MPQIYCVLLCFLLLPPATAYGQSAPSIPAAHPPLGCEDALASYREKAPAAQWRDEGFLNEYYFLKNCQDWAKEHRSVAMTNDASNALDKLYWKLLGQFAQSSSRFAASSKDAPLVCKPFQDFQKVGNDARKAVLDEREKAGYSQRFDEMLPLGAR